MRRITGLVALTLLAGAIPNARAGSYSWSSRGPLGGPLSAVVVDPSNASVAYVGSFNGGVFKTRDGGAHWIRSRIGLGSTGSLSVNCLAVDPVHPTTLYSGLDGGLFKSVDGGSPGAGGRDAAEADIARSRSTQTNRRGCSGDRSTGVWESADGGALSPRTTEWNRTFRPSPAIDPASLPTAFAGTFSGHLYRTVNGGIMDAVAERASSVSTVPRPDRPANSSRVWVGCDDLPSTDGAPMRTPANIPFGDILSIALAAPGSPTLLAVAFRGGPFRSTDRGAHWIPVKAGLSGHAFVGVAADPAHAGRFYLTGDHTFETTDSGSHWTLSEQGLAADDLVLGAGSERADPPIRRELRLRSLPLDGRRGLVAGAGQWRRDLRRGHRGRSGEFPAAPRRRGRRQSHPEHRWRRPLDDVGLRARGQQVLRDRGRRIAGDSVHRGRRGHVGPGSRRRGLREPRSRRHVAAEKHRPFRAQRIRARRRSGKRVVLRRNVERHLQDGNAAQNWAPASTASGAGEVNVLAADLLSGPSMPMSAQGRLQVGDGGAH